MTQEMVAERPAGVAFEAPTLGRSAIRRAVIACGIGQVFEMYDFVIYAFMAAQLAKTFFPNGDPLAGLLATFATFAVGFVMRPAGAVVIGSYGDRYGRRAALVLTIGLMAVGTGAIGLIPPYATCGIAAPIALVLCRMAQGFSTGGEWGGAAAFLVEYAPAEKRGLISSYQQGATGFGLLFATLLVYALSKAMSEAVFTSWGWRLAFLLGFVLGPIAYYLRRHVKETPAFQHDVLQPETASPLRSAFARFTPAMLIAFGLSVGPCIFSYTFIVYLPSFAQQQLHINASITFLSATLASAIYAFVPPLMGAVSDKIGRRAMFLVFSCLSVSTAYPLFAVLTHFKTGASLIGTQCAASMVLTIGTGPMCAALAEMFPTRVRYTALSVSYGLAVAIFGGFAPYISTYAIHATGNLIAPAFYTMFGGVITFGAALLMTDRARKPLLE